MRANQTLHPDPFYQSLLQRFSGKLKQRQLPTSDTSASLQCLSYSQRNALNLSPPVECASRFVSVTLWNAACACLHIKGILLWHKQIHNTDEFRQHRIYASHLYSEEAKRIETKPRNIGSYCCGKTGHYSVRITNRITNLIIHHRIAVHVSAGERP